MSLANVSIVGNLVKDPEMMHFSSGRSKATFVVAVNNRQQKQAPQADFYRVETWGKLAELSEKYLEKGNQVTISGRLVLEHWTDRHGVNRITPVVEASQVAFPPRARRLDSEPELVSFEGEEEPSKFEFGKEVQTLERTKTA